MMRCSSKDYYKILGVKKNADDKALKKVRGLSLHSLTYSFLTFFTVGVPKTGG